MSDLVVSVPKIVKLTTDDDDPRMTSKMLSVADIAEFSLLPELQEELMDIVRNKVFISNELQQYILGKEIDYFEKYLSVLLEQEEKCSDSCRSDRSDISCESVEILENGVESEGNEGSECSESSCSEEESEIEYTENHLKELNSQMKALERRSRKASDYLNIGSAQFKITTSFFGTLFETERYKVQNKEWISSFRKSMNLQKVKLIFEKLVELDIRMDISFWTFLVLNLLGELNYSEKLVASGIIIEMVIWTSMNCHLMSLLKVLIINKDFKEYVFSSLDKIICFNEHRTERILWTVKVLSALIVEFSESDEFHREKYGRYASQLLMRSLEDVELKSENLIFMIEIFESFGQQSAWFFGTFDRVFTLFRSKSTILEISEQNQLRVNEFLNLHSSVTGVNESSLTIESHLTTTNVPITEGLSTQIIKNQMIMTQEKIDEMERVLRIKIEEEFRTEAEKKEKERKQKEEEEEKRKREEMEKKKKEEEEVKKLREKNIEDEKKAEELKIKKQKEEYKKKNPCTFITCGTRMYRHANPGYYYERDVFDGKLIGLLFSGQWCPACIDFVPILKKFHAQVKDEFEVLFVSRDRNEQEMNSFLEKYHGDWYNFSFNSPEGNRLHSIFGINQIPTLLVLKPNGTYRNISLCNDVRNSQNPITLVNEWKKM